jgi:tyrosyl-tRNA synthetase
MFPYEGAMSRETTFPPVDEQLDLLLKGAVDVVTEPELRKKLERSVARGVPLAVKVGFDPTAPDIHLGHTVLLRKMRHFQRMGHRVIFLIGDFTGRIGDPTGRSKTRPPLTDEAIRDNAETYREQCFKILDPEVTEIRFNNEWLEELGSNGLVRLAARYSVARMLERKDFKQRFQSGQTIAIHEFLYPLAQAYDSVALRADVELGGTDQLFNLNVGRDIMPGYDLEPQVILTTPLLEGLDGVEKMSKSLGNYVGITEAPEEMFGKLMSIDDPLMWRYYELCTDISSSAIAHMRKMVEDGSLHPKRAKEGLATRIVADFHDEAAARRAHEHFRAMFEKKEIPDDMPEFDVAVEGGRIAVSKLLASVGLATSNSEGLRLVRQGAVQIDGGRVDPATREIDARAGTAIVLKVGKRRFARARFVG